MERILFLREHLIRERDTITVVHFSGLPLMRINISAYTVLMNNLSQNGSAVATVSVNSPVSVNVDNNGRCRSRYCKRVYNNGTVIVNVDSYGSDLSRYCQRLH